MIFAKGSLHRRRTDFRLIFLQLVSRDRRRWRWVQAHLVLGIQLANDFALAKRYTLKIMNLRQWHQFKIDILRNPELPQSKIDWMRL